MRCRHWPAGCLFCCDPPVYNRGAAEVCPYGAGFGSSACAGSIPVSQGRVIENNRALSFVMLLSLFSFSTYSSKSFFLFSARSCFLIDSLDCSKFAGLPFFISVSFIIC